MNKELNRFIEYLNNLYYENTICVFYRLSGHVNWLEFSIRESKKLYGRILYSNTIMLYDYYGKKIPESKIRSRVNTEIKEINTIIDNLETSIAKWNESVKQDELAKLAELKAKYGKATK